MKDSRTEPRIWVHLAEARAADDSTGDGDPAQRIQRLMDRVSARASPVCLLVPASMRGSTKAESTVARKDLRTVWYTTADDLDLPRTGRKGWICIVNGQHSAAERAHSLSQPEEKNVDLVVFSQRREDDPSFYGESVTVDGTGRVVRFQRHYHESRKRAPTTSDDAVLIQVRSEHAHAVTVHLVARGWGRASIEALGRRFSIRWSHWPMPQPLPAWAGEPGSAGARNAAPVAQDAAPPDALAGSSSSSGVQPAIDYDDIERALERRSDLPGPGPLQELVKRGMDITVSFAGLVVLFPFLAVVAALVRLTSPGPAFFAHRRQGRGGREFRCFKFRTMVPNAHEQQQRLREINEVDGPQFKITDDPRITRIGKWLRRYNVDEVPQLWNVLCGDMSLVGPRPSPDEENQLCPAWRRARLSVRPGLTGLWQVLRRREHPDLDFQEWIYYDMEYVRHRCLWLDLQLLLKTPRAMFAAGSLQKFVKLLQRRGICRHAGEMGWTASAEAIL